MLKPRYEGDILIGKSLKEQLNIRNKRTPKPEINEDKIFSKKKTKKKCNCGCKNKKVKSKKKRSCK